MAKESARIGSARVRKLVHVDREEVRKFKRGLPGLRCASRDAPARMCILRCSCSKAPTGSCMKALSRWGERASLRLREPSYWVIHYSTVPGYAEYIFTRFSGPYAASHITYCFMSRSVRRVSRLCLRRAGRPLMWTLCQVDIRRRNYLDHDRLM
ncbi:hypothetical protein GW17_00058970 [Ensete ventricosum]|nr:hypothetical protein GW17_00058970 [Ensete ventricosum]